VMKDPKLALVGTLCDGIDVSGNKVRPGDRWRIVRRSAFAPFPHGSIMYRRSAFDDIGGYCEADDYGEDADLYLRILTRGKIALLPEVLYHYRYHTSSTTLAVASSKIDAPVGQPSPDALYTLTAMRLWAGHRPDVLKILFSGSLRTVNLQMLRTLVFAVCGNIHPGTFRWVLCRVIQWRDWLATFWIDESQLYEWRGDEAVKYCES